MSGAFRKALWAPMVIYVCSVSAFAQQIELSGIDHEGYLSLSGVNTETSMPDGSLDMPYYFDSTSGLWVYIAASPLSADSVYAEESNPSFSDFGGKTVSHASFGSTDFGNIVYDASLISGVGTETIDLMASNFNVDLFAFGPRNEVYGSTNVNGEFNWDYGVETLTVDSANPLPSLTFQDGQLTSIDGVLDIGIKVRFLGNEAFSFLESDGGPVATYDGTLSFSGLNFEFSVDEIQDVNTVLGDISSTRLVFNRRGSLFAVPEPSSMLLLSICGGIACAFRRRNAI